MEGITLNLGALVRFDGLDWLEQQAAKSAEARRLFDWRFIVIPLPKGETAIWSWKLELAVTFCRKQLEGKLELADFRSASYITYAKLGWILDQLNATSAKLGMDVPDLNYKVEDGRLELVPEESFYVVASLAALRGQSKDICGADKVAWDSTQVIFRPYEDFAGWLQRRRAVVSSEAGPVSYDE
jgi:hypothetical protein